MAVEWPVPTSLSPIATGELRPESQRSEDSVEVATLLSCGRAGLRGRTARQAVLEEAAQSLGERDTLAPGSFPKKFDMALGEPDREQVFAGV